MDEKLKVDCKGEQSDVIVVVEQGGPAKKGPASGLT